MKHHFQSISGMKMIKLNRPWILLFVLPLLLLALATLAAFVVLGLLARLFLGARRKANPLEQAEKPTTIFERTLQSDAPPMAKLTDRTPVIEADFRRL